ncbi:uncharacterized protein LOC143249001 isoform X2 [Tachypleus tridentatus]|uniref:uncharacterized protein LOC143249001 isoform X2 n=1 Tax=Tachypleus tridentatus TaxID=6853 RepID=UPI003FD42F8E
MGCGKLVRIVTSVSLWFFVGVFLNSGNAAERNSAVSEAFYFQNLLHTLNRFAKEDARKFRRDTKSTVLLQHSTSNSVLQRRILLRNGNMKDDYAKSTRPANDKVNDFKNEHYNSSEFLMNKCCYAFYAETPFKATTVDKTKASIYSTNSELWLNYVNKTWTFLSERYNFSETYNWLMEKDYNYSAPINTRKVSTSRISKRFVCEYIQKCSPSKLFSVFLKVNKPLGRNSYMLEHGILIRPNEYTGIDNNDEPNAEVSKVHRERIKTSTKNIVQEGGSENKIKKRHIINNNLNFIKRKKRNNSEGQSRKYMAKEETGYYSHGESEGSKKLTDKEIKEQGYSFETKKDVGLNKNKIVKHLFTESVGSNSLSKKIKRKVNENCGSKEKEMVERRKLDVESVEENKYLSGNEREEGDRDCDSGKPRGNERSKQLNKYEYKKPSESKPPKIVIRVLNPINSNRLIKIRFGSENIQNVSDKDLKSRDGQNGRKNECSGGENKKLEDKRLSGKKIQNNTTQKPENVLNEYEENKLLIETESKEYSVEGLASEESSTKKSEGVLEDSKEDYVEELTSEESRTKTSVDLLEESKEGDAEELTSEESRTKTSVDLLEESKEGDAEELTSEESRTKTSVDLLEESKEGGTEELTSEESRTKTSVDLLEESKEGGTEELTSEESRTKTSVDLLEESKEGDAEELTSEESRTKTSVDVLEESKEGGTEELTSEESRTKTSVDVLEESKEGDAEELTSEESRTKTSVDLLEESKEGGAEELTSKESRTKTSVDLLEESKEGGTEELTSEESRTKTSVDLLEESKEGGTEELTSEESRTKTSVDLLEESKEGGTAELTSEESRTKTSVDLLEESKEGCTAELTSEESRTKTSVDVLEESKEGGTAELTSEESRTKTSVDLLEESKEGGTAELTSEESRTKTSVDVLEESKEGGAEELTSEESRTKTSVDLLEESKEGGAEELTSEESRTKTSVDVLEESKEGGAEELTSEESRTKTSVDLLEESKEGGTAELTSEESRTKTSVDVLEESKEGGAEELTSEESRTKTSVDVLEESKEGGTAELTSEESRTKTSVDVLEESNEGGAEELTSEESRTKTSVDVLRESKEGGTEELTSKESRTKTSVDVLEESNEGGTEELTSKESRTKTSVDVLEESNEGGTAELPSEESRTKTSVDLLEESKEDDAEELTSEESRTKTSLDVLEECKEDEVEHVESESDPKFEENSEFKYRKPKNKSLGENKIGNEDSVDLGFEEDKRKKDNEGEEFEETPFPSTNSKNERRYYESNEDQKRASNINHGQLETHESLCDELEYKVRNKPLNQVINHIRLPVHEFCDAGEQTFARLLKFCFKESYEFFIVSHITDYESYKEMPFTMDSCLPYEGWCMDGVHSTIRECVEEFFCDFFQCEDLYCPFPFIIKFCPWFMKQEDECHSDRDCNYNELCCNDGCYRGCVKGIRYHRF